MTKFSINSILAVVEFHYLSPYLKSKLDKAEGVFPLDLSGVPECLC